MKLILLIAMVGLSSCYSIYSNYEHYRIYQISDMDLLLQDYYTNELKRISPGLACGDYKMENKVGCFKLLADPRYGKAKALVYQELSSNIQIQLYEFEPPTNNVFIEKIFEQKLVTSNSLPEYEEVSLAINQPSVRLVFFEKSSVVFYWENGEFHKIWTSD